MKLLLIYPPFCNPGTFPYSISSLKGFLLKNIDIEVKCLDLNAKYHRKIFGKYYKELEIIKSESEYNVQKKEKYLPVEDKYAKMLSRFILDSSNNYRLNNKAIREGKKPDFFDRIIKLILEEKPDIIGFSLVYNSQCFYAHTIIDELKKHNIVCIAGGPAANEKIREKAIVLSDETELLEYLKDLKHLKEKNKKNLKEKNWKNLKEKNAKAESKEFRVESCINGIPDFSDYKKSDYLAKEIIIPLKSSTGCYYKKCAFCTHHSNKIHYEYPLETIKEMVIASKEKNFFFIDDMISKTRLIKLSEMLKPLKIKWWCQLRPTKEFIGVMGALSDSGLKAIAWGVECGSQNLLDKMNKGTNLNDIKQVLKESSDAGIKNTVFIMFGFPTETRKDFLETIEFLKENQSNIHMVSTSIFGLQKGSPVYENPKDYGIKSITEEKREYLEEKIDFSVKDGLTSEEVRILRKKYSKSINNIDKFPRAYNYFREQIILLE